jgi:hypothetical protein
MEGRASPHTQLLVFGFDRGADFGGGLVGALERLETGGTLRVLDVLFVHRDADSDELVAVDLHGRGAGSTVAPLLGFRLDAAERRKATERALGDRADQERAGALRRLAVSLEPGGAVAAVLVEHVWAGALHDAVARTGGRVLDDRRVDATTISELVPALLDAARARG